MTGTPDLAWLTRLCRAGAIDVGLPGGWRLHRRVEPTGCTAVEVADARAHVVGAVHSATVPMLSVAAAWRGWVRDVGDATRWWALAMGHARIGEDLTVAFCRRDVRTGRLHLTVLTPTVVGGVWVAATAGPHVGVSCRQGRQQRFRRLTPMPGEPADVRVPPEPTNRIGS